MIKKFLVVFTFILVLTGCAKKDIPLDDIVNTVMQNVAFDEELSDISDVALESIYNMNIRKIDDYSAYIGTGFSGDEFAVFKINDNTYIKDAIAVLEDRIQDQIASYTDYKPEIVPILEGAIIHSNHDTVVLIITKDYETAKSVLNEIFK